MADTSDKDKSVLLVVDAQVGVLDGMYNAHRVVQNIVNVLETARANKVPVIWIQHFGDDLIQGSPEWEFAPELVRENNELLIHKQYNSAFENTSLVAELASENRLILCWWERQATGVFEQQVTARWIAGLI